MPKSSGTIVEELGKGLREKVPSTSLRDFITHTVRKLSPSKCSSATRPP